MLNDWKDRATIGPAKVGFYGFSLGGSTGLVLMGTKPDFARGASLCKETTGVCAQLHNGETPPEPIHDARIAPPSSLIRTDHPDAGGDLPARELLVGERVADIARLAANISRNTLVSRIMGARRSFEKVSAAASLGCTTRIGHGSRCMK